jgi:multiple sugar transport system permease protein
MLPEKPMATTDTQVQREAQSHARRQRILNSLPGSIARALLEPEQAALRLIAFLLLLVGACIVTIPFLWMLSTALKPDTQVYKWPPVWIPHPLQWRNFSDAIQRAPFPLYARNTLIITVCNVIGVMASSSLTAFGFARLRFPGREALFAVLLVTMMLPGMVTLIPQFVIFARLDWINTWLPLIIPSFFGSPFFVFLLRQFFQSLPQDYHDAAKVDGASSWTVFWRIFMPLSRPALATVIIFQFMWTWSGYLGPFLFLHSDKLKTISVGLSVFLQQYTANWQLLMAASTMMVLPMVLLFFVAQKYFIQGITTTGLTGR